jgi:glycosyltransferase involved in cell wall biosynthesis
MSAVVPSISVVVITRDEAHNIADCLASVSWVDEIIVLDSGSTDATVDIARRFTSQVFETDWPGFGPQKNRALAKAGGDWVLSLDADERIPPSLADEIRHVIDDDAISGYDILRHSSYLGRTIRFGDWRGDRVLRLFRRDAGRFSNDLVHERLIVDGVTGHLKAPMIHHSFSDLEEVLDKVNRYSSAGARMRLARGQRGSLGKAMLHGSWAFLRGYVFRAGFLDGREGFLLAMSAGLGSFYRYAKMIYLSGNNVQHDEAGVSSADEK